MEGWSEPAKLRWVPAPQPSAPQPPSRASAGRLCGCSEPLCCLPPELGQGRRRRRAGGPDGPTALGRSTNRLTSAALSAHAP